MNWSICAYVCIMFTFSRAIFCPLWYVAFFYEWKDRPFILHIHCENIRPPKGNETEQSVNKITFVKGIFVNLSERRNNRTDFIAPKIILVKNRIRNLYWKKILRGIFMNVNTFISHRLNKFNFSFSHMWTEKENNSIWLFILNLIRTHKFTNLIRRILLTCNLTGW